MKQHSKSASGGRHALVLVSTLAGLLLGGVSPMAVAAEFAPDGAWTYYGGTQFNTRYSPLKQINDENVGKLKVAYTLQLGSLRSNEATPIVIGDTMYVASSWGPKTVFALDARNGAIKWQYAPEVPDDIMSFVCCDVVTRGVTYGDDKIFVGRLDGFLVALDAKTGKELWTTQVADYKSGASISSPPVYAHGIVVTGYAGADYGLRGSIQGYDAKSGKELWRTYMTALKGEPNGDTWKGDSAEHGGGDAWNVGSYDENTDTVLWGTGNASPYNPAARSSGTVEWGKYSNLYTASTVALDPNTGKIKWHMQSTPDDVWDYDSISEVVLADLDIGGKKTPAFMKADKNGFFLIGDRDNGKFISADPYVPVTWATGYDQETGVPIRNADKYPTKDHKVTGACPSAIGGKDWQPISYNPGTGLAYISANNSCTDIELAEAEYKRGTLYLGVALNLYQGPGGYGGELMAWDPVKRRKAWSIKQTYPYNGGTMTTAGNLVFFGDWLGMFHAYNAKTGDELWKFNVGSGVGAGAMTYQVDGKQYVAIVAGRSATIPLYLGDLGKRMVAASPEGGALVVFELGN
jgi:PQQ-dependent dehydrogenase (methanol/ethanol family)